MRYIAEDGSSKLQAAGFKLQAIIANNVISHTNAKPATLRKSSRCSNIMEQPLNKYKLEKSLWTEDDFEMMGWHDCHIHAIGFGENFELLFDIDYIFKWVTYKKHFDFWVSPCTMVFENVYDIDFDLNYSTGGLDIDAIDRGSPEVPQNAQQIGREIEYTWKIELQEGSIKFKSVGYKQFVRRLPVCQRGQYFDLSQRGGISFERM